MVISVAARVAAKITRKVRKVSPPGTVKVGKRFRKQNLWEGKGITHISDKEYDESFYHYDASGKIKTTPEGARLGFKTNVKDHNDPGRWIRGEPDSRGRTYTREQIIRAASKGKYPDGTPKVAWEKSRDEYLSIVPKNKELAKDVDFIRLYSDSAKAKRKATTRMYFYTAGEPSPPRLKAPPIIFAYMTSERAKLMPKITDSFYAKLSKREKRWAAKPQKKLNKMQPFLEKYETYWDDPGPFIKRYKKPIAGGTAGVVGGLATYAASKKVKKKKKGGKR